MKKGSQKSGPLRGPLPESYLLLADRARSDAARRRWARAGLKGVTNRETQFLLLEQLFRADLRDGAYEQALRSAEDMIALGMLADGAHARAAMCHLALGQTDAAERALRQAVSRAPGQRRAFHLWNLGAFLHMQGRLNESLQSFARAERIAPLPLTRAHAALVRVDLGEPPEHLPQIAMELEADPGREGYGQFVLGSVYLALGDRVRGGRCLRSFIERTVEDPELRASLRLELEVARARLSKPADQVARSRVVVPFRSVRRAR